MASAFPPPASPHVYQRHRPETTALYEVVRCNLETMYGAILVEFFRGNDGKGAYLVAYKGRNRTKNKGIRQ
jgi:hypothetical protein